MSTPPVPPGPPPPSERRQSPRQPATARTFCYLGLIPGLSQGPFQVDNLSTGGLRLILGPGVQVPGLQDTITVQLHNRARKGWASHPGQVVYVQALPSGRMAVGCAFARDLSDQELAEYS